MDNLKDAIEFDALYESMLRCRKGVGWKDSVASYYLNGIENTLKLERELKDGTYRARSQKKIEITHPKPRTAVSIAFRDRVYQRSLNDNLIYPAMSESFIMANVACQKGKGTDFARSLIDRYLHEAYRKHGLDAYVLRGDIVGYYPNMSHAMTEECFKKHLPPDVYDRTLEILRRQYDGDKGYNPGSQMIQIAGLSVLSPMDHFIKEKLRVKWYIRYMDDFRIIHPDRDFLEKCLEEIRAYLGGMGFELSDKKTKISSLSDGIDMLGFIHKLTETGKVIRLIDSKNVKAERKHLFRLVQKAKRGDITKEKADACFEGWKAHAKHGNTYHVIKRMEHYYSDLWKGDTYESGNKTSR